VDRPRSTCPALYFPGVHVRVTGVVIEAGRILLLNQDAGARSWSLPGGKLEDGETLAEALVREMKEETGSTLSLSALAIARFPGAGSYMGSKSGIGL
jgi:ADP-ribose pyrophosphatase YjhB (NUDIX family)